MIPWRLQFSGIRDYGPEEMNLDTANEHVLITGPNGSGKSTISFCMGAVLRSSKVDVSGLKSQNLPEDETWRASVRFLFKNEGPSRIDGPLYIEFRLLCEQHPNQALKLHYEIHDGDDIETLELRQIYRSGDVNQNNFTAYQRALEYKYKIQPDLYYLIWYQQEVNQFAVMAPEERFRIFSEMHGIDKIQKDWEVSREVVNEARESFVKATTQQKNYEFELSIARKKKEQFESNRRRLTENGFRYAQATNQLHKQTESKQSDMQKFIEEREFELADLSDELHDKQALVQSKREEKQTLEQERKNNNEQLAEQTTTLSEKEAHTAQVHAHVKELSEELSELTEAYQKLTYTEAETNEKLAEAKKQAASVHQQEEAQQEQIQRTTETIEHNREEQSHVQAAIHQWEDRSNEQYKLLERYASSYDLKKQVENQQHVTYSLQKQLDEKKESLHKHEEQLDMLKRNRIESPRQKSAIRHLKQQGIKAYPFRRFVQLKDDVTIAHEHVFDAIKYTIFVDASSCKPSNDLYHVALRSIVPERLITELPKWGLRMRDGLSTDEKNQAARVLWWVDQFFKDTFPTIKNNVLLDQQGTRGPQEEHTYILSEEAVAKQKKVVQQEVRKLHEEIQTLTTKLQEETEKLQIWNSDIRKVEEAEAFLTTKAEQDYRIKQLASLKETFQHLQERKATEEETAKKLWEKGYHLTEEVKRREYDLSIYEQFGEQSKKIKHLQDLEKELKHNRELIAKMKQSIHTVQDELDRNEHRLRTCNLDITTIENEAEQTERTIDQVAKQKHDKEDERVATAKQSAEYKRELEELTKIIPELVEEAIHQESESDSKYELQNIQNQAKVEFGQARSEKDIDPYAVENYETLEAEVVRKKEELISAKNLLEENEERAIQNEQYLENAIAMQVQKIHLLFEQYIGEFQFEGRVKYEKTFNKKEQPIFKLYIQVRKEGHRGKFEDVSLKARGGRVGKGVSGGEESLSSLLFALSLLQNLENRSSFIVMDEFDSALDESRKTKVFELYANKLQRKLIIISPKGHEDEYYNRFSKAFVVSHNPIELQSTVKGLRMKKEQERK